MTCLGTTHVTYVTHDVIFFINKMLSKEDRVLTKVVRVEKGYGAKRIITEFPGRNWSLASGQKLAAAVFVIRIFGWFCLEFNFWSTFRCILQKRHTVV